MSKRPIKKITKDTFFNSIQVRSTSDATNWRTPDVLNIKFTSTTSPNSSFGKSVGFSTLIKVRYTYTRRSYTRVNMLQIPVRCILFLLFLFFYFLIGIFFSCEFPINVNFDSMSFRILDPMSFRVLKS